MMMHKDLVKFKGKSKIKADTEFFRSEMVILDAKYKVTTKECTDKHKGITAEECAKVENVLSK